MVENRPILNFVTHAVLILGVLFLCFPVWMALVASTHGADALSQSAIPFWFGGQGLGELQPGFWAAGLPERRHPFRWGSMMLNSLIMALGIAGGKIIDLHPGGFCRWSISGFPLRMALFLADLHHPDAAGGGAHTAHLRGGCQPGNAIEHLHRVDRCPLIASATATFLFRQFFLTIPDELVEAARIDRAGPIRFFLDILLPMSRTNIAALFIILFIYGWNQYLWPLLVTTDEGLYTVVMGIQRMVNSGEALPVWHYVMGTAVLGMIPPIVVVVAMQKLFVKGLVESEK